MSDTSYCDLERVTLEHTLLWPSPLLLAAVAQLPTSTVMYILSALSLPAWIAHRPPWSKPDVPPRISSSSTYDFSSLLRERMMNSGLTRVCRLFFVASQFGPAASLRLPLLSAEPLLSSVDANTRGASLARMVRMAGRQAQMMPTQDSTMDQFEMARYSSVQMLVSILLESGGNTSCDAEGSRVGFADLANCTSDCRRRVETIVTLERGRGRSLSASR